ncbi:hypothetical protein [Actinomadura latina]|uniref:hypothetical protein n=1 Tax=Actinomadura latina TaxID=163603 RepID=UPI00082B5DFE|nr:hypothetical protein [Actinomadura latina]
MKTRIRTVLAAGAATVGIAATTLAGSVAGPTEAKAAGGPWLGCPYGAVCIYTDTTFSHITQTFWSYGPHNLVNQYGRRPIVNNQYGGATATLCYGYNGTNCDPGWTIPPKEGTSCATCYALPYLTPYNSIVLNRP